MTKFVVTPQKDIGSIICSQGVNYCVWAPKIQTVCVEIASTTKTRFLELRRNAQGYHSGHDLSGTVGDRYAYFLDNIGPFPDPASRAQEASLHGRSLVVDPAAYCWTDHLWQRPPFRDLTIYELHVGTFTPQGTFRAAINRIPHLCDLGITAIEIMPIADFPGSRNWGYDGVLIFAPARCYGRPADLRDFVNAVHRAGIAVILDVVYNHFGPDGNYLSRFSPFYFTDRHKTPWGSAFNFDGKHSGPVRNFFLQNLRYWMNEYHIDGFRFDATHEIIDDSETHILGEMTSTIHAQGGYAIAEDDRNEARMITSVEHGGFGFDGVWADDFHHVIRVAQTREQVGYFKNFKGTSQEMTETLSQGWLYHGQPERSTGHSRGTPGSHLSPERFVHCISNHDQIGNRAFGERLHQSISPAAYRMLSALLCLSPYTPLLFMGQEWMASSPFLYFTDHEPVLGHKITAGRRKEFSSFPEFADSSAQNRIPDPQKMTTFQRSKLHWSERNKPQHAMILRLYSECLWLRKAFPVLRPRDREQWNVTWLSWGAGLMRFKDKNASLLVVFDPFGGHCGTLPSQEWTQVLSTEELRFGGSGAISFNEKTQQLLFKQPELILMKACK